MRKLGSVLVLAMLIAVIPVMADAGDKIIRFGVAYSSPTGDYTEIYEEIGYYEELTLEPDAAIGPYFGFEFMVTDLVGIDGTLLSTDHDVDLCAFVSEIGYDPYEYHETLGSFTTMPLFISAHFHVVRKPAIDFYVGPTVGYVFMGDLDFDRGGESVPIDDEFGYGVVSGIDIGSGAWTFSTAIRYILLDANSSDLEMELDEAIGVDPWIVHVGASRSW